MRIQKQLYRHDPENGVYGDCMRTCYAVLLGRHASEVPHFMESGTFDRDLHDDWMREQGLQLIRIQFLGTDPLENILNTGHIIGEGVPFILSGWSRTPSNHCVIAHNYEIVCDPSLNDSGIVGPMHLEDGTEAWWIEYLVRRL